MEHCQLIGIGRLTHQAGMGQAQERQPLSNRKDYVH